MRAEVEFVLDALTDVVLSQPNGHPLRRVDRDRGRIYDSDLSVDLSAPLHSRKAELEQSNLVGVASQSRDVDPLGTDYDLETDIVLSVRVEGLDHREFGHVDPAGQDGVVFDDLYADIRETLYDDRTYPTVTDSGDAKLDIRIQNEDFQDSDFQDYYRREFDLIFRGREALP